MKNIIEIKEDIKIGNIILEAGDKIRVAESDYNDKLAATLKSFSRVHPSERDLIRSEISTILRYMKMTDTPVSRDLFDSTKSIIHDNIWNDLEQELIFK